MKEQKLVSIPSWALTLFSAAATLGAGALISLEAWTLSEIVALEKKVTGLSVRVEMLSPATQIAKHQ